MIDLSEQLSDTELDALMAGVVRGRYHVLLGAGASHGGTSADGRPLPGGWGLARELQVQFGLPEDSTVDLRRTFAAAAGRRTTDGKSVYEVLKERFLHTTPPTWLSEYFLRLPWAQVWSLNIDDCVERAYGAMTETPVRNVFSISWTERHRTPRPDREETLLIHLHGKSSRAREGELVFDIRSYLTAAQGQHRWHAVFGDTFPFEPFLVIGASLDGEIDLQAVLDQGLRRSNDHPSLIVLDKMSDFQREEYARFGLIPVRATAEDFFEAVRSLAPRYLQEVTHEESVSDGVVPPELLRFLSQWTITELDQEARPDPRHDFYAGHEPEWSDVLADLPMRRELNTDLVSRLTRDLADGESAVECVFGDPFTGKSTLLLTLVRELLGEGFRPALLVPEMAPSIETAIAWLRHYPRTVFVADRGGEFSRDFARLQERAISEGLPMRALLVDRSARSKDVDRTFGQADYTVSQVDRKLTRAEIEALLHVLGVHRRLGVLRPMNYRDRMQYFQRHDRELFASMADLESGRGFGERIRAEYQAVPAGDGRQLLLLTCIASALGHGLPMSALRSAVGISAVDVDALLSSDELADLVVARRNYVHLRMRSMGETVLRSCVQPDELLPNLTALASSLGAFVSPAAITARTSYYRLVRDLMNQQILGEWLHDVRRVLAFYEATESVFDWNARFWEQRALAAAAADKYEPAFSWALEAVARHEDPYTTNTVGTVLMRRALYEATAEVWPTDSFENALEYLSSARDLERDDPSEYPFETFFGYASRLVTKVRTRDAALNEQLKAVWRIWHTRMLVLPPGSQKRLAPTYRRCLTAWHKAGLE